MATIRQNKFSRLLKEELSTIFQKHFPNLGAGGMITITIVRITPDLGLAKVYLSVFGASDKEEVIKKVNATKSEIRNFLGKSIGKQVRKIPDLAFYLDDTLDEVDKINALLDN